MRSETMVGPEMQGWAEREWAKLTAIVEADVERQIDEHTEDKHEINKRRARLGLKPI